MKKQEGKVCNYSVRMDGKDQNLIIDCLDCSEGKAIGSSEVCMSAVLGILLKEPEVDNIILSDLTEKEYDKQQVSTLKEIAEVIEDTRYWPAKRMAPAKLRNDAECKTCFGDRGSRLKNILDDMLFKDPAGAYVLIKLFTEEESKSLEKENNDVCLECRSHFIKDVLQPINRIFDGRKFFKDLRLKFETLKPNDRTIYNDIFTYLSRPYFSTSRIIREPSPSMKLIENYEVGEAKVGIYMFSEKPEYMYFLIPGEYSLDAEKFKLINEARNRLLNFDPKNLDFSDTQKVVRFFKRTGRRMVSEANADLGMSVDMENITYLSEILAKYTAGMGIIEVLLSDEKVTDVYINSPISENPLYLVHRDYGECSTNIYLTQGDVDSLISRFRARSGRAFSEAMPVLDMELPEFATRVCTIGRPIAPDGISFALRRAKPTPWTLPQFIENRMLNPFTAGLLSMLIDGQCTMLVAGSRGSGKTSLLAALMGELPQRSRILTIEDTLELPVGKLNETGFKIQRLKVQSAISQSETEMGADDALRAALRLGESVLVLGEVRGAETKVLYEAMRVGAAGNAVMGTIHGSSTRDVFERVVYDLGVAPLSFKSTDVVVIATPVRLHGSSYRVRRIRQISEIGKAWQGGADSDKIFEDLVSYDASKDSLNPTSILLESRSEVILKVAKSWGITYEEAIKNIEIRGRIKELMVKYKQEYKIPELLEIQHVQHANNYFRVLVDKHQKEYKKIKYDELFTQWKEWLDGYVRYLKK